MSQLQPASVLAAAAVGVRGFCEATPPEVRSRPPSSTASLPFQQARSLINALAFALAEQPARDACWWHFTIVFEQSEAFKPCPRAYMALQGRTLDQLTRWLRRQGLEAQYLWVREAGRFGQHTHLVVRLPAHLRQEAAAVIHRAAQLYDLEHNVAVVVTPRRGEEGMHTTARCSGVLRDLLKTMAPCARFNGAPIMPALGVRHRSPCVIHGKRSGVSQSLSRIARAVAGWRELETLAELRAALPTGEEAKPERRREKQRRRRARRKAGVAPMPQPTPAMAHRSKPDLFDGSDLAADFFEGDAACLLEM